MRSLILASILILATVPWAPTAQADHPCSVEPEALDPIGDVQTLHVDPTEGELTRQIQLEAGERLVISVHALNVSDGQRAIPWLEIQGPLCHLHYIWGGPTIVFTADDTLTYTVAVDATAETDVVLSHAVLPATPVDSGTEDTWIPCGASPYCGGTMEDELCGPHGCEKGLGN